MQRKPNKGWCPVTEAFSDLLGPMKSVREATPQAAFHFTQADQVVLCRLGVFFVLTFALLTQSVWGQRIGPLGPTDRQQSKALSTERAAAAVGPPSLQLSLSPPAAIALPPLGPDDLQRLQPQEGQPPVIGVHRRLPAGALMPSFSEGTVKTTAEGAWQSTAVGRLWRLKMTSPSARAMRIHFRDFAIGAGSLWLHSASGQVVGPYTGFVSWGEWGSSKCQGE